VTLTAPGLADETRKPAVPLFEGLGNHSRKVETHVATAQRYFDQGLMFMFAFNHDEPFRAFRQAAEIDPGCAMAYWGIALASGMNYNDPSFTPEKAKIAADALASARQKATGETDAKRALIDALGHRYPDPAPKERADAEKAYSRAMKAAWQRFSTDADLGALYAESLMNLRPWDLWTRDGQPQPETPDILRTLEAVLKLEPAHPLANHLYIHALEAAPEPGKADAAADALRGRHLALGHLLHMLSHIDIRRGRWQQALEANRLAIRAGSTYQQAVPEQGFYRLYMSHNYHMLTFAAMMQGQSGLALTTIRAMTAAVPREWLAVPANATIADGFAAMPLEVLKRFGRWDDILKEPQRPKDEGELVHPVAGQRFQVEVLQVVDAVPHQQELMHLDRPVLVLRRCHFRRLRVGTDQRDLVLAQPVFGGHVDARLAAVVRLGVLHSQPPEPSAHEDHVVRADAHALLVERRLEVLRGDDVAGVHAADAPVARHAGEYAAREEYAHVLDAELLQAVSLAELGAAEAVVEVIVAAHADADVAEAVELRADLADLTAEHLIVVDKAVGAVRAAGRRAGDGKAEVPLAKERHAVLVDPAELIELAVLDQPGRFQDLLRRQPVGGAGLVGGPPSDGHQGVPIGVSCWSPLCEAPASVRATALLNVTAEVERMALLQEEEGLRCSMGLAAADGRGKGKGHPQLVGSQLFAWTVSLQVLTRLSVAPHFQNTEKTEGRLTKSRRF
jgi:hypothetical protein